MKREICCVLLILGTLGLAQAAPPYHPDRPVGFSRVRLGNTDLTVLKPDGWFVKEEATGFFITKEDIDTEGRYQTGLSFHSIFNIDRHGMTATDYALRFASRVLKNQSTVVKVIPLKKLGPVNLCGYRIRVNGSIAHTLLVADDAQAAILIFTYESPEANWEEASKIGRQITAELPIPLP